MAYRAALSNFSKGEIAPELLGRFDVSAYSSALRRARNVLVLKYGGVTKRPGTRLVAEVYDASEPVRLVPFQFSIDQAYALELGQGYMRPAAMGGMVTNEELEITAITNAANAKVTAAYHGYSEDDQVFFFGVEGMDEINGRIAVVESVIDDNNFTVGVDSRAFGVFTGSEGGITRSGAPDPEPLPPVVPAPVPPPPAPPVIGGGGGGRFPYWKYPESWI